MSLFGQNDDSSDGEEKGLMENTNAYLCCYKSNQSHRASVLNDKDSSMATINIKGIVTSDNQMSLFEDNDDSSDDEEEDIMENINVYLNDKDSSFATLTTDEMTPPDESRNSPSDKKVSFLMDHEAGIESKRDLERSREELLAKIKHLTNLLKESEQQIADEKYKRKKKETYLLKLAKELKRRNAKKQDDQDRIEELLHKKNYLEHHWVLAQKELDQEKAMRIKQDDDRKTEYDRILADERTKHVKELNEQELRITELKKAHAKQCDDLCREILKANLEADRLHGQLNNGSIRKTDTFFSIPKRKRQRSSVPTICIALTIFLFVGYVGNQIDLFTREAFCSPVFPGTTLKRVDTELSFEAPWWAPDSMKETAFEKFCSQDVSPTTLEWKHNQKDMNKIVIKHGKKVFKKKGISKGKIFGSDVRLWNKKGLAEDFSLWSL